RCDATTGKTPAHLVAGDGGGTDIRLPGRGTGGKDCKLAANPGAGRQLHPPAIAGGCSHTTKMYHMPSAAMPASAICASCCEVTPLTPTAPTSCPPAMTGTPPSRSTAFGEMEVIDGRVLASSSKTLVGRLNAAEVRALPIATSILPVCVPSIRCR